MTDVLSAEELDALLAGTEGVTPGKWRRIALGGMSTVVSSAPSPRNDRRTANTYGYYGEEFCIGAPVLDDDGRPRFDYVEFGHDDAAHIARCSPDTIRKLVTEVQALRHSRASGVKVRELVWVRANVAARWTAKHAYGEYEIIHDERSTAVAAYGWFQGGAWGWFPTIEAAKSAAQSHFNASIQSCIVAEGVEVNDEDVVRAMDQIPGVDHDAMVRAIQAFLGQEIEP